MLAAAIWHNVLYPIDVNRSGTASPIDALVVINELGRSSYSDPETGELDSEIPDDVQNPYFDVNCDSKATPRDALYVINRLAGVFEPAFSFATSESISGEVGVVTAQGCDARLTEGDSLRTEITATVELSDGDQGLRLLFDAPEFDLNSTGVMQDAFEVAVTDQQGRPVTQTFAPGRHAALNWSERTGPAMGSSTSVVIPADSTSGPHELLVNLAHLPAGEKVNITARLVNNDGDLSTSVVIRDLELVSGLDAPSDVYPVASGSLAAAVSVQPGELEDITGSIQPSYGRTSYSPDGSQIVTDLIITNRGDQTVTGEMIVVLDRFSEIATDVMHPDGILSDGRPFFRLTQYADGPLSPGESTRPREIRFANPGDQPFSYRLTTLGDLNAAPGDFESMPISQIDVSQTLKHTFIAEDPDGDSLIYSIVSGPAAMVIDAQTGRLQWQPDGDDIGRQSYSVRAIDPHGLFTETRFDIEVLADLPNRPPTFVSAPVTDAIASSGFEVTTVGVGDSPAGIGVISGFQGPRLVTANSGDQTIGVYAGRNNDRFDDAKSYATGFPTADGQIFDTGYSVDIGLPVFQGSFDENSVFGLDQGDLNGDGILDLAVLAQYDARSLDDRYQMVIRVLLGDGIGGFGSPHEIYRHRIDSSSNDVRNLLLRDIDNDGNLDVLAAERRRDPRLISILGNGDGTFQSAAEQTFVSTLSDFRTADVDEDGTLDLIGRTAILGSGADYDMVWSKGSGDGTFSEPIVIASGGSDPNCCYVTQQRPYDVLDLNDDGHLDLAFLTSTGVNVYHSDGAGNFALAIESQPSPTREYGWIRGGDFNRDGEMDLAYHDLSSRELNVLIGDGSGTNFVLQLGTGDADGWLTNYAGSDAPTDIDGDGDLDLIFANSQSVPIKVALNDGAGFFSFTDYAIVDFSGQIKAFDTGDEPRGAMLGDYNRDGVIDYSYFTAGEDFNGVGIRLGTRPGKFGQTRTEPWFDASTRDATPGDYNGDGIIDLLDTNNDRVALGIGNGTFLDPFPAIGVSLPTGFGSSADFNSDGLDDIVATRANQNGSRYYIALANGDGTFSVSDEQLVEDSFFGYSATMVKDFNNDGYPDFLAKTSVERQIDVHLNDSANPGVFSRTFRITLPEASQGANASAWENSFDAADYTGDGFADLLFARRDDSGSDDSSYIVVYAGDGAGNFNPHSESILLDEEVFQQVNGGNFYAPGDFDSGDLDHDGDQDLVAFTNYGARVFLNDGAGSFELLSVLENPGTDSGGRGRDSWLVDYDQDGNLDLFQTGTAFGPISVRLGNGDATFQPPQQIGLVGSMPAGITREPFADFDGDGHLDFVYATAIQGNYRSPTISVVAGRRDDLVDMITVDLNGDGNEEILAIQEQMERLQVFVGDNLGGFTRSPDLQTGRAPQAVAATDLTGDGRPEILVVNRAGRSVSVFTGSVDGGYDATVFPVGSSPIDIASANLNGDDHQDLVVLDEEDNAIWVIIGNGTTTLATPTAIALGDSASRLTLEDATGDGLTDAVLTLPDTDRIMILPGDGAGGFTAPMYVTVDGAPSDVAVVDLNDDGNPDLAATLPGLNVLSVSYGTGSNQFARPQNIAVGEMPNRVVLADADEDGRTDLIVANEGDQSASVIYNRFDPNEVYQYDSDAIDPDDDALAYSIVDGPGGLIINGETGKLLWAASPDQVGIHDVTIAADDGRGGVATQSFKIAVEPARENSSPIIASESIVKIGAGESYSYNVHALDNENHTLRYSLVDGPSGASIHATTGQITWDGRSQSEAFGIGGQGGVIRVPEAPSLKPTSITIEGWFNLTELLPFNQLVNEQGILLTTVGDESFRVDINRDNGRITRFFVPRPLEVQRWYHVALTYDAATAQGHLYIDGELAGSGTGDEPTELDPAPGITNVGRQNGSTRALFDNYRVWNYARSEAEIQEGLSRQYDGDNRLILDFRFEETDAQNVKDYSNYGNHGYRTESNITSQTGIGLSQTGEHEFTVRVDDGRGGSDLQTFTLDIVPELRGSITGRAFDDLNGDGDQDDGSDAGVPAELSLANWHVFIDLNNNAYPDPHEPQAVTDVDGYYHIDGLLPGDYRVRISPVAGYDVPTDPTNLSVSASRETAFDLAVQQLSLSHIRGQLLSEDGDEIAYWKVFADLDGDGQRGENEPMAISDRNGDYALTGLDAGDYTIRPDLPAGWSDTAGGDGLSVTLDVDEILSDNDFTLAATNTSVTGGVHFVTMPQTTVEARHVFRYASVAYGISNPTINYDLSLAPDGMAVDPTSGLVAWRPTIDQVGEHLVILRAAGEDGSISLHDFYLTVTAPNTPPVIVTPGEPDDDAREFPQGHVGRNYRQDVVAQDAENHTLQYSLIGEDHDATIDTDSGRFTWSPSTVGSFSFIVRVTDELGASTDRTFTVNVLGSATNVTLGELTGPRTSFPVLQRTLTQVHAVDSLGRPVDWSSDDAPEGFAIDDDGVITWNPSSSQLGEHRVSLVATDADGQTFDVPLALMVVGSLANVAPVIKSPTTRSAVIGREYRYDVQATDDDGDPLSFALLESPAGMSIDARHGTIRWTPADDQLGEADVTVRVADTYGAETTQDFTIKVSRVGGPPIISSVPESEASVGIAYFYSIEADDAEDDPLTYRLLSAPTGMTIAETTGEITWTPTIGQLGEQGIVIEVSDGIGGAATQAFSVRVSDGVPNQPPSIDNTAPRFAAVGEAYQHIVAATDPESTTLTFSLPEAPAGMMIDDSTGQIDWTPAAGQDGKHVVTIRVSDAGGAAAIESFELDILAQNTSPTISSTVPIDVAAGAEFKYDVLAGDADADPLTYELTTAPAGATIDAFGRIRWMTEVADLGSHDFEIRVGDPRGGETTQSFTLDVIEDTVPPKLSLIENLGDAERNIGPWDGPFVVYVKAIDNVAIASLTLQANGQDIPLDAAGTAKFAFEDWTFQEIVATATAVDTNGNITSKTITFDYDTPQGWGGSNTDDVPTASISSPADTDSVAGMVSIVGTAAHDDLFGYTLSYRRIDSAEFIEFHESTTAVTGGELGVWDTSLLLNDEYVIRLEVATNAGVVNVVEHNVGLGGQLKLGNFRLAFTDMVIPVAGIPIEITRIYDTLQADREGDFGYGWRLEYRNTDLRVGLPESGLEDIGIYSPLRPGVKVYLNVPGEGRQGFTFDPIIQVLPGFGGDNLVLARPRFTPDPGVTSTLSTGINQYLQVNAQGELHAPGGIPYNPASPDFGGRYELTTREGTIYQINGATGKLDSATDRNGNVLQFTDSGISYGDDVVSVQIKRDSFGRITSITDPNGNDLRYEYSETGDLRKAVDREGNATSFTYAVQQAHYLEDVIDPLGRTGARTEYDENGRLINLVDALGNAIAFASDPDNFIETITDADGNEFTLEYDQRGNVVTEVDRRGAITRRTFDSADNLTSETDPLGNETKYAYDRQGNVTSVTDPLGGKRSYTYGVNGFGIEEVDEIGATTTRELDSKGNVLSSRDPLGNITSFAYDANGNVEQEVDAEGYVNRFIYDMAGNLLSWIDVIGQVTSFTYDGVGNRLSERSVQTTPEGILSVVTSWTYDANDRETSRTDAMGNVARTEYNDLGSVSATIDERGNRTEYEYDDRGLLTSTRFADGSTTSNAYDKNGRLSTSTDQLKRVTRYVTDQVGNIVTTIHPDDTPNDESDNPRTNAEYDLNGRRVVNIDELGSRRTYEYDADGRVAAIVLPDATPEDLSDNIRTEHLYDGRGLRTSSLDPLSGLTSYHYDLNGNLLSTHFADGTSTRQAFDSLGRRVQSHDENGILTAYEYDPRSQLTAVVQTLNGSVHPRTEYQYDEQGNLLRQTDANGNSTDYHYDLLGQRVGTTMAMGQQSITAYDAVGNVATQTNFNGETVRYTYDRRNRPTRRELPDGTSFAFTYTPTGQLNTIVDDRGTTTYAYDARDQVVSRTEPDGVAISYTYDLAGRETSQTTPAGTVSKAYNELGNLTMVTDTTGQLTTYAYDDRGRLVETQFPNGVTDTYTLDDLSRILRIESNAPGGLLRSMKYTLDATGRRIGVAEHSGRVVTYEYDSLYRLIAERIQDPTLGDRTIEYAYDLFGNRLSKHDSVAGATTYTYDANDRLLQKDHDGKITIYTYDANGNTVAEYVDDQNQRDYTWDAENRMVAATIVEAGVVKTAVYKHDAQGLRVEATIDDETTRSLLDKNARYANVVVEYAPDLGINASYVRGHQLISMQRESEQSFYHADAIGTVRSMTNQSGVVVNSYVVDAFGKVLEATVTTENPFLLAGELRDSTLGWDFLRERYLNVEDGRFASRDPFDGFANAPLSLNRFTYVHNDPVNYVDPSGEIGILKLGVIVFVVGLAAFEGYQAYQGNETYIAYEVKNFVREVFGLPTVRRTVANTKKTVKRSIRKAKTDISEIKSILQASGWASVIGAEISNNTHPDDPFFAKMLEKGRELSKAPGGGGDEFKVMVELLETYLETVREEPQRQTTAALKFHEGMIQIGGTVADSYRW